MYAVKYKSRNLRGFNLVEAAIVLGVIGLVIGGIWTAAAEVQRNRKLTVAASSIGQVVEQTRILFKNMPGMGGVDVRSMMPNAVDPSMLDPAEGLVMPRVSSSGRPSPVNILLYDSYISISWDADAVECLATAPYLATRLRPTSIVFEGSETGYSLATPELAYTNCNRYADATIVLDFAR